MLIEKEIDDKWQDFYNKLMKAGKGVFSVDVDFYEKRKVKKLLFGETEEDYVFEKWHITFGIEELNKEKNDGTPIRPDVLVRVFNLF